MIEVTSITTRGFLKVENQQDELKHDDLADFTLKKYLQENGEHIPYKYKHLLNFTVLDLWALSRSKTNTYFPKTKQFAEKKCYEMIQSRKGVHLKSFIVLLDNGLIINSKKYENKFRGDRIKMHIYNYITILGFKIQKVLRVGNPVSFRYKRYRKHLKRQS